MEKYISICKKIEKAFVELGNNYGLHIPHGYLGITAPSDAMANNRV
jgi:hypothetical protein